ncbi:hypothetical protein NQ314_005159 [Rhamnusium bicolor]|uniref:Uncharacterized protein n=1 Tax=Rhamnusium bicolor TaxID=1586634 RepID=A0AAV8ZKI4_9CUCU|nr:hypothetical protein NQ314_005159 [Rhamnusium bicolor]
MCAKLLTTVCPLGPTGRNGGNNFEGEIADLNVSVMSPQLAPLNSSVSTHHASRPSSSQSTYSMTTSPRKRKKVNRDIKELITSATSTLHNLTSSEPSVNLLFEQ